ncbi:flagellar filament capping protein FliD [Erythrobacter sp. MTPC3]|uniref:flagellar filament capping protein FliD n=1 Tax=Erythrobacter sp. MTPC3 TaxID=3056564 RepID=UPI0036F1A457
MDSSVSSVVSRLGAGSGLDMVQLANDLAEVRYASQIQRLETRNERLEAQISSASVLRNQLTQLAGALGDRIRNGDLAPAPIIGAPSVATPSVVPGTSPSGSYDLEVTQLAASQTLALNAYSSGSDLVGEGTLTLRFGAVNGATFSEETAQPAVEIAVAADDTLETLAGKINAADRGVTAYVANGTNGAQLVLKGADGEQNGFVIEAESTAPLPSATTGDLSYLAWDPSSDSGQLRQGAQDALFSLDTIAMRSASNRITDLPEGLTLDLTGTNPGAPTTISFADRSGQISGVMNDFVAALNDITGELQASAAALGGELGNDPGARALKRALSGLSSVVVMPNAGVGEPSTLGDLGLSVNRNGSFALNDERLNETLSANPDGAAAMFTTGLFGVFATIDGLARSMSVAGDPGSLAGSVARYTDQIERNDEKLAKISDQQEVLRERMVKQFAAADRNISQSNSTLSFIRSQIAIWKQPDN